MLAISVMVPVAGSISMMRGHQLTSTERPRGSLMRIGIDKAAR
ncbi:MAG TPA: hypothetical protein VN838_18155 [Bradyrhizobium sp.]|nr:hypothetical protein [Bradyrhizobium sp.]